MTPPAQALPVSNAAVIVASPNAGLRRQLMQSLKRSQVSAAEAVGGADALGKLEASECQMLLLDRQLPDLNADELLETIHKRFPGIDVLLLDEAGNPLTPSEWRSAGGSQLLETIERWQGGGSRPASASHSAAPEAPGSRAAGQSTARPEPLPGMVGQSPAMTEVYRLVRLVAPRSTPALITGATGTGKELVANAIHRLSPRAAKPFVVINCAAIPDALLESELFGYVRGAFTGAVQSRLGRVHSAHGGTLFLDEVGELPLALQSKLLRFLDQGEVQRLGSADVFRVDVRVITATNADLGELARRKQFREDLLYRLSVFPIDLPALSQRREDVVALAQHFLQKCDVAGAMLTVGAQRSLVNYSWPGNVRELQHVIERAAILAEDGAIRPEHLGAAGGIA